MKALVCGGRNFANDALLDKSLMTLHVQFCFSEIVHGAQRGADLGAKAWADSMGIKQTPFPADWDRYGDRAGNIRNARMLAESKPDIVVAFPGGTGTQDMISRALAADVPTYVVREDGRIIKLTPKAVEIE